jgi:hypothetical protein
MVLVFVENKKNLLIMTKLLLLTVAAIPCKSARVEGHQLPTVWNPNRFKIDHPRIPVDSEHPPPVSSRRKNRPVQSGTAKRALGIREEPSPI